MDAWKVVTPSNSAENLARLLVSIRATHASVSSDRMLVVDDGAQTDWTEAHGAPPSWIAGLKPFQFARNVNLGILAVGKSDVILVNDDCELETLDTFDLLAQTARDADAGIVSPGIVGFGGSEPQWWNESGAVLASPKQLAFICVYVPRRTIERIGLLDERFTGYGGEDVDYCWRVQAAGLPLVVDHRVRVHHARNSPSAWRTKYAPDEFDRLKKLNDDLLEGKWRAGHDA